MIRTHGSIRRMLAFTEDELEAFATEFADYAAQDIADLLGIQPTAAQLTEIAIEVEHAIRSTINELPHERLSPSMTLRGAAAETLSSPSPLRLLHVSRRD